MSRFSQLFSFVFLLLLIFSSLASASVMNHCPRQQGISPFECSASRLVSSSSKVQELTEKRTFGFGVNICNKFGGDKGVDACSFLFVDRPWQVWPRKTSKSMVKVVKKVLNGGQRVLDVTIYRCWQLSQHLRQTSQASLVDQWCYIFWNWYHGPTKDLVVLDFSVLPDDEDKNKALMVVHPPTHNYQNAVTFLDYDHDICPVVPPPLPANLFENRRVSPMKLTKISTGSVSNRYQHVLTTSFDQPADAARVKEFQNVMTFALVLTILVCSTSARLLVMWGQGDLDAPPRPPPPPRRKSKKI